jgi:hypothetical protein
MDTDCCYLKKLDVCVKDWHSVVITICQREQLEKAIKTSRNLTNTEL